MCLIRQHALFGTPTAPSLLSPYLFMEGSMHIGFAFPCSLDLVQQQASREESIQPLLPSALRLHLEPGRAMCDHDASGSLVDVLAAVATRTHKCFLQVRFLHSQVQHAPGEVFGFIDAYWELAHALR